jgi:hypothetical protein
MSSALGSTPSKQEVPGGSGSISSDLVGVWSLVSFSIINEAGSTLLLPMGKHPDGTVVYTADGWMSAHLLDPMRHTCSAAAGHTADTAPMSDVESVTKANPYVGYSGTYECRGNLVVHHVRIASVPQWINKPQVRRMELNGDMLTLRPPTTSTRGHERTPFLVWRRLSGPA